MTQKYYNFEKLTPDKDADISVYEEAIEFVFDNSDVTNIAISGAYGAGKSSVIESYEKKHDNKNFLHISLAHFEPTERNESEDSVKETTLEGKILNQLIHQIPVDRIPQTNFRVKKDVGRRNIIIITILLYVLLGSINVLGDIQEKYVNVLKTVISDISVIQNKKLWNEMLDKRIIKKTVPNIIHYYTEYCCDSQLIKFINECDAGMDYSHIENEFGGEIARQFFDSVAVNNEIKTSRYQEILCNMGYGYDVYDAFDISDDKMEVLIKKDVIEMNNVGLEYIRNHYKKYTALYIDENIEAYLRIITSDNFSYEEALHILGMEIGDKEKIDLLGLTTEPISVVGKGYSSSLIKYILDNNFDEHDENELYQHFSEYEEVIQSSIYRVAKSRIANIIDNSTIVLDDNLLSELLTMSKCSMDDKIQLWAKALPNLTEETCKKHFDELGFPELKGIFTKRNNYTKTYEDNSFIRDILYVLKKNTWIFDYYKKSDDEGYVVVKNPIKDKRY